MRWIGGSPCGGKSTIASSLASRYELHPYHCDDHVERHVERLKTEPDSHIQILQRGTEERLRLPVGVQVCDEFTFYRDEFHLILEDIGQIAAPVIAEAAALLPECISALHVPPDRAVWIVPTGEFQRHHYARRDWAWELLRETADPPSLFDQWMRRDAAFARIAAAQARTFGYRVIVVDGSRDIGRIEADVTRVLRLPD